MSWHMCAALVFISFIDMDQWRLCFILLLPLSGCFESEVTIVKTTGREDQTPVCTSATLTVCNISTERRRGGECLLKYKTSEDFFHGCDSRFTLTKRNQTVFLHLNNLTSEDSGNYTCKCTSTRGTFVRHLIVTVEGLDAFSRKVNVEGEHKHKDDVQKGGRSLKRTVILLSLVGAATVFIVIPFFLGVIYCIKRHSARSETPGLYVNETPRFLDDVDLEYSYENLQLPGHDDIDQTVVSGHH
ncbi:uncharacterized protein LOC102079450 [Oreochromis niloticus]|uniref:uncharacterized protein LOC102079450 n=1 Tax=Oreochromis niloticus TaxID=8128 RepID=UPI000674BC47|nr:uncharacterized protein LOC102079450 [Oreochromis niloticus]